MQVMCGRGLMGGVLDQKYWKLLNDLSLTSSWYLTISAGFAERFYSSVDQGVQYLNAYQE